MLNQDALQYLVETGKDMQPVIPVHETREKKFVLVRDNGAQEIKEYDKDKGLIAPLFSTLKSFCEFLTGDYCKDKKAMVFIGEDKINARIGIDTHHPFTADIKFKFTPEIKALCRLKDGVNQKELWRLLVTDLSESFDPELLLSIGKIKVADNKTAEISIDSLGGVTGKAGSDLVITFPGKDQVNHASIKTEWEWTGDVYEMLVSDKQTDRRKKIKTRLEITKQTDGSILFRFHPKGFDRVEQAAREEIGAYLTDYLKNAGADIPVYSGTL